MQIIDRNDCYVSKDDLMHLFDNDERMPLSLQLGLKDALVNNKDYVKITEDKGLEYIYTSDIPTFESMAKLKISALRKRLVSVVLEGMMNDYEGTSLTLNEIIKEKRNREYIIKQIKEMIAFKKRMSTMVYPDIPYPYITSITDGEFVASPSYNLDRIVIYNLDGSKVEDIEDVEFCNESFKLLTHDLDPNSELDMKYDGNYFVVKNAQKQLSKKRIVE
jgi:hypothetical protein